jgi:hypothetical protein
LIFDFRDLIIHPWLARERNKSKIRNLK